MIEAWAPIANHNGRYEVSNLGRVRSTSMVNGGGRVLSPGKQSRGYLTVQLYFDETPKRSKSFCVHDLVAGAFIGSKPLNKQVNHKDGNKSNNVATNLEYVTPIENVRHAIGHGLGPAVHRGSSNVNSKLTDGQVAALREIGAARNCDSRVSRSMSDTMLARIANVSPTTVGDVMSGHSYTSKHGAK